MYGNSGKFGRGGGGGGRGGGGAPKRGLHTPLPPPPPPHRPVSAPRLPIGSASSSRQRPGGPPPSATEETFSLVSSHPLAFGMIIRLTPDIVEEIRRVEYHGGTARIKFDSNANNPSGNVIEVGGKDFRFTWSRELGDCDIYEERRSGDNRNGLLVESGSAWRKLNVQRILDESTKNHVKMRSEEAERLSKSRKAIVLDPANPSVKNQAKTMAAAAVESNMRRMPFKKKEPAFKKQKFEPNQGPPKSVFKSGMISTTTAKSRLSVSPLPSPPEPPVASASPFGVGGLSRIQANADEVIAPQVANREDPTNSEKEVPSKAVHASAGEVLGNRSVATPMDLRSTLISLLMDNPKGMSLKDLKKAVGDMDPNSGRKIEAIIRKIATYQAPGRYFLNPGVEMESFKKPSSESGSSPECAGRQTPIAESTFVKKTTAEEFEPQTRLNARLGEESNVMEKIDTHPSSPDNFASDKKIRNDSEPKAGSSSESGSDSDSDSDSSDSGSDSGSQSRSRSKSRSPAGSGSASSSDSESDGSSSSKEGSDVDVDIMTSDDEKEEGENKLQGPESRLSTSPGTWRSYDNGHEQNGNEKIRQDGRVPSSALDLNDVDKGDNISDAVDTDDLPMDNNIKAYENHETEVGERTDWVPHETNNTSSEERMAFSPDRFKQPDNQRVLHVENFANDVSDQTVRRKINGKNFVVRGQPDSTERVSKAKSKRASDPNYLQKSNSSKKLKAGNLGPEPYRDNSMQMAHKVKKDGNADPDPQKGYGLVVPRRSSSYENAHTIQMGSELMTASVSDAQQSSQKTGEHNVKGKAPDNTERPSKYVENMSRGTKYSERLSAFPDESDTSALKSTRLQEKLPVPKDRLYKERQDEDSNPSEKSFIRNFRENAVGDKLSTFSDSQYRKYGEQSVKSKDSGQATRLHMTSLHKDSGKPVTDRGNMLRREPSELELGEFREPVPEEAQVKKQIERKGSFKSVENKSNASDCLYSDSGKGRPAGKAALESKKQSPHLSNQDGLFRKRLPEDDFEDSTRSSQKAATVQAPQCPRVDNTDSETGTQLDKLSEIANRTRKNEARTNQLTGHESHLIAQRKLPASMPQQYEPKNGVQMVISNSTKENKPQRSSVMTDSADRKIDNFWMENNSNGGKRRESSSDEDDSFYLKYDKDEPELRGPIKDYLQYEEYVQEYREKYDHYCSLNTTLESYRNDFQKLGRDLELAKGTEGYFSIFRQLVDTYHQCITVSFISFSCTSIIFKRLPTMNLVVLMHTTECFSGINLAWVHHDVYGRTEGPALIDTTKTFSGIDPIGSVVFAKCIQTCSVKKGC